MVEKVKDRMRRMCSRREYCVSDVRKKLMVLLDGDRLVVQEVLDELVSERYVDDLRYASAYARDKSSIAGWGETKIRYMLSSKGISRENITAALREIDPGRAMIRLDKLLENKYRSLKDDPQCRLKLLRFGLGRGYAYEDLASAVDTMIGGKNKI